MAEHQIADERLTLCPFCGGGETRITEHRRSLMMDGTSTLIGADLRHWCAAGDDTYQRLFVHIRARDEEAAIATWNRRKRVSRIEHPPPRRRAI